MVPERQKEEGLYYSMTRAYGGQKGQGRKAVEVNRRNLA